MQIAVQKRKSRKNNFLTRKKFKKLFALLAAYLKYYDSILLLKYLQNNNLNKKVSEKTQIMRKRFTNIAIPAKNRRAQKIFFFCAKPNYMQRYSVSDVSNCIFPYFWFSDDSIIIRKLTK